jgi:hypothetical protein
MDAHGTAFTTRSDTFRITISFSLEYSHPRTKSPSMRGVTRSPPNGPKVFELVGKHYQSHHFEHYLGERTKPPTITLPILQILHEAQTFRWILLLNDNDCLLRQVTLKFDFRTKYFTSQILYRDGKISSKKNDTRSSRKRLRNCGFSLAPQVSPWPVSLVCHISAQLCTRNDSAPVDAFTKILSSLISSPIDSLPTWICN